MTRALRFFKPETLVRSPRKYLFSLKKKCFQDQRIQKIVYVLFKTDELVQGERSFRQCTYRMVPEWCDLPHRCEQWDWQVDSFSVVERFSRTIGGWESNQKLPCHPSNLNWKFTTYLVDKHCSKARNGTRAVVFNENWDVQFIADA